MISPENKKLLEELGKSNYGRALKSYCDEKLKEIGDITKVESWDETLGKKYAVRFVRELLSVMEERQAKEKSPSQYT